MTGAICYSGLRLFTITLKIIYIVQCQCILIAIKTKLMIEALSMI